MKSIRHWVMEKMLILGLAAVFTLACSGLVRAETWKLTSLNWQPYSGAEMTSQGNAIQKLRMLLKEQGITLVVEFYPWKRAQYLAAKPEYVGYFPAWPEEVGQGFVASPPVASSTIGYIKRQADAVVFNTVDELFQTYRVGIVSTYVYPDQVTAAIQVNPQNIDKSPDEVSLLKKLSGERFQVAITDPNVMMYLASQHGISNVEPMEKTLADKPLVIAFREGADNQRRIDLMKTLLAE